VVWRVPYPTGGPPVPTSFRALAFLAFERWFGLVPSLCSPFPPPPLSWPHRPEALAGYWSSPKAR
jgi:hypothetical protein